MILPADPRQSYLSHKEEIDAAVQRVLESGWYIHGDEVVAFEEEFARYVGVSDTIGVGSGTEALHLALRACGVGPGDAVLTVSHTAVATIAAIELAGAEPVLVDVEVGSYTMDPNRLEETIEAYRKRQSPSKGTDLKAVIPVHLYGHPADMEAIVSIANRHGLLVVEDCAQAHGATVEGRMTGSLGTVGTYSFYPTKNLGALGDAGALVTNDRDLAEKIRLVREYGWRERYVSEIPGLNSRLDAIQAAVLRVKLKYLDEENEKRRNLAAVYDRLLSGCGTVDRPLEAENSRHVYHQYVIRTRFRDQLRDALKKRGIGTLIHYPVPVHLQPAYAGRLFTTSFDTTERICREILSLPITPGLSTQTVGEVAAAVRGWCEIVSP